MIVAYLLEAALFLYYCHSFVYEEQKGKRYRNAALFFVLYVVFKELWEMKFYVNIFGMAVMVVLYLALSGNRDLKLTVWLGLIFSILIQTGRSTVYSPIYALGISRREYLLELRALAAVIKAVMVMVVSRCFRQAPPRRISFIEYILATIPLSNLIYLRYYFRLAEQTGGVGRSSVVAFVFLEFSVFVSILAMVWRASFASQRAEDEKLEQLIREQYHTLRQREEADQEVRRMYHDLKHQVLGLVSLSNSSQATEMADDILRQLGRYEYITYSDNPVLNAILNEKAAWAEKTGVSFQAFIDVRQIDSLHSADLCSIFGNVLDNAIEAAVEVPDPEKKTVTIKAMSQGGFFVVKVSNYFSHPLKKAGERYETTKTAPGHGIGLSSVRHCVKRYGGTVKTEVIQDQFVVTIVIPEKETVPDSNCT